MAIDLFGQYHGSYEHIWRCRIWRDQKAKTSSSMRCWRVLSPLQLAPLCPV